MLQENRFFRIVSYLKQNGTATLNDLAAETESSIGTVRRDLKLLEQDGMLRVVRGGAVSTNDDLTKQRFQMRGIEHKEEKQMLGSALHSIVVDGQAVALNGGTTNVEVAKYLVENYRRLTIITNNLYIFRVLKNAENFTLIVPGGLFDHEEYATYGKQCEAEIRSYNIDVALLGINAISLEKGITDFRLREVGVIRALLESAKKRVVVADHSKFDRIACVNVCGLDEIDCIVSDGQIGAGTLHRYENGTHVKILMP